MADSRLPPDDECNNNVRSGLRRRHSDSALVALDDHEDAFSVTSSWAHQSVPPAQEKSRLSAPRHLPASYTSSGAARRSSPRHSRPRHINNNNNTPTKPPPSSSSSIPDKLAQGAWNTTLDLLKLAGGVTLSTTGKLVALPIHVTRTVILPALWAASMDYIQSVTPTRIQDWCRIVSSSVHHVVTVLRNTPRGRVFREKVVRVGGDVVDVLASDVSRQALVDATASLVKFSEALHTPEMKALLDQLSVLGCRLVDVASSGRNKRLLCDLTDTLWAGIQVTTDPAATLALAEVTAYINHALEMEDAVHRGNHHEVVVTNTNASTSTSTSVTRRAAQRRYERNRFQRQTYTEAQLLQDMDGSTVEDVLLSSLGGPAGYSQEETVPSNIRLDPTMAAAPLETPVSKKACDSDWTQQQQQQQHVVETVSNEDGDDGNEWDDIVDTAFLEERISLRAAAMERQREQRTPRSPARAEAAPSSWHTPEQARPSDDTRKEPHVEHDVEDLGGDSVAEHEDTAQDCDGSNASHDRTDLTDRETTPPAGLAYEKSTADIPPTWRHGAALQSEQCGTTTQSDDDEPASARFYRYLDEIMNQERTKTVNRLLATDEENGLSWYPHAAAAAGAGNERGQDTIKSRIAAMRRQVRNRTSDIGVGHRKLTSSEKQQVSALRDCAFGLMHLLWFLFGCYGVYAVFLGGAGSEIVSESAWEAATGSPTGSVQQEVVVRIVRQVVHVQSDGEVIQTSTTEPLEPRNTDALAACVANAMG